MKVLILTNYQLGLYKFRKELLEALVGRKYKVYISVPDGEFTDELKVIGCKVITNNYLERRGTNLLQDKKLIQYYYCLVMKLKPDVVLTYTIKPNIYGGIVCGRLKVPYITNITGLGTSLENSGMLSFLIRILYRIGLRRAQMIFLQNSENLKFMVNHRILNSTFELLPGSGVNLKQYSYQEYPTEGKINFVFISRILKEKGIDQYLDAAKEIKRRHFNTQFHICGKCESRFYKDKLDKYSKEKIIIYHGEIKDMREIYKMSSCTIHPTYYSEGMSNVLLESAATGRPIITTDRPGCKEIVDDGINGFFVKEQDSEDLIKKIEKFLSLSEEEKAQLGRNGRIKVEKLFDRTIVVEKYLKEIDKLEIR